MQEERDRREQEERERREREEKARWEKNQREKEEEQLRRQKEEAEEEKNWRAQRDAQKQEAERLRLERERQEENRRREEQRRREEEERRQREERERREADERRADEERRRLENDAKERERQLQKQLLLAKMKEIDEGKRYDSGDSPSHNKKEYKFTEPIENMHRGKPAREVSVPVLQSRRKSKKSFLDDDDDDDVGAGGYKPTFTSNTKSNPKPRAKKNLMDDLFGDSSANKNPPGNTRDKSSTQIYGGGNALISDTEDSEQPPVGNSHLLPRRPRQQTTTLSKPSVNAVDPFDDDIEEVVL